MHQVSAAVGDVALVLRLGVGVVEYVRLGDVGVHPLLPLLRPELGLQVLDRGLDEAAGPLEVDFHGPVVVLHEAAVDGTLCTSARERRATLPVRIEQREDSRAPPGPRANGRRRASNAWRRTGHRSSRRSCPGRARPGCRGDCVAGAGALYQAVAALPYYWDTNPGIVRQASHAVARVLADTG